MGCRAAIVESRRYGWLLRDSPPLNPGFTRFPKFPNLLQNLWGLPYPPLDVALDLYSL